MPSLNMSVKELDDVMIIRLNGFLNADTSSDFEEILQKAIDSSKYNIIVDFERLDYISSAGVGCFIGNIKKVRKCGGDIRFLNMPPKTQRVFELLDFQDFFKSYLGENEAIASFSQ